MPPADNTHHLVDPAKPRSADTLTRAHKPLP